MKNKKKILALIPILLTLTGCQKSYYPFSMADMGKSISYLGHTFLFGLLEWINKMMCGFYQTVYYVFARVMTPSDNWISNELTYYTDIFSGENGGFIFTVSLLACAYILINFVIGIYKTNFATTDNQYSPTAVELIKKVLVALVVTFAIPYIAITGFSLASRLGTQAVANIKTDQEMQFQLYEYMDAADISYNTVCNRSNRLEVSIDEGDDDGILSKDFSQRVSITLHDASGTSKSSVKTENKTFKELYSSFPNASSDDYTFWCGTTGEGGDNYVSVGENLMNNEVFKDINPVSTFSVLGGSIGATAMAILFVPLALATIILLAILSWSVLSSFAKRTADIVVLIAMSWFYIGASVSDTGRDNHLSDMFKKLLTICISQFLFMLEVGMMIRLKVLTGGVFWLLAWIMVLNGTPTIIEDMVGTTGTAEAMTSFSKKLWSGASNNLKSHM